MLHDRARALESLMTEFNLLGRDLHAAELRESTRRTEGGLGFVHFKLFSLVAAEKDGIAVKDLASVLGVTSSAVTQLVDPLVAHGYLVREADPEDRRSIRIRENPKGAKACRAFRSAYLKRMTAFFSPLSDAELRQCLRLVTKMRRLNHI